ncbi:MAG: NUDIX domain-containing protein [Simkaniaceae bacterium]|nr:NUDIX domain-containing protein [Simkaniaceae bacterium]
MSISPEVVIIHVFRKEGNVVECLLLHQVKEKLKNNWQIVTGRIKESENTIQGALRELKEETGLVPDYFYSADFVESYFDPRHDKIFFAPVFVAFVSFNKPVILSRIERQLPRPKGRSF